DADGQKFNIEVQLDPRGASEKRARYYASLIDSKALQPGQGFGELPEVWVIFITEGDHFRQSKPLYHFVRREEGGDITLHDGSHIIYVNGANREAGTALSDLMHDFFCRDVGQMRLAQLAQAVQRYKTSEQGAREMSSVFEEIREEGVAEGRAEGLAEGLREAARRMLRIGGMTVEIVARITGLDEGEVQRLGAEAQGSPA
ncbi:MAG: PD-(D/E)XK nuclease family transposase, partial [Ottowia sp.]|nr:PD-(D/E)XK nuclease family transposase [Ottowia sp.]